MKRDLVFEAPRRGLPPRHLADLDAVGRAAAVAELGLPPFRAKQLAQQYYARLLADPNYPLLSRAFGSSFSPGSTFKLITSSAALAASADAASLVSRRSGVRVA